MSSFNELVTTVVNTFGTGIKPQILQIANLELVKHVNTGDRVKDGAIVIVLNTLLSLSTAIIYYGLSTGYKWIKHKYNSSKNNGKREYKINVQEVLSKITKEEVEKYPFSYGILTYDGLNEVTFQILCNYLNENNIISEFNSIKQINLTQNFKIYNMTNINSETFNKVCKIHNIKPSTFLIPRSNTDSYHVGISNYFTPIEVYNNFYGENEYIFLCEGSIVSKSSTELSKFITNVIMYHISKRYDITNFDHSLKINEAYYDPNSSSKVLQIIEMGNLNNKITFDSIYFDNKPILLDWINKFSTETLYPKNLCLVNKLGILLYGPPGTGKTGCICALANKLNRDVLTIKTLSLKGQSQYALKQTIKEHQYKSIIVLDEIDYLLNEQTNENENEDKYKKILSYNEQILKTNDHNEKLKYIQLIDDEKLEKSKSLIDIHFILSLLDGVGNDTGRVIIATTNNPDKINPLFLRPGRFDVVMKLGYCSFNMFKDIIKTKYEELTNEFFTENENKINELLKLNITPLILINKLVISSSIDNLLIELSKLSKQTYTAKPNI